MKIIDRIIRFARELKNDQRGQMAPILLSAVMVGYSAFLGATLDMGNLWLHKLRAERAANAACLAGSADLLWASNQTTLSNSTVGGMTVTGSGGSCPDASSVCFYAKENGYPQGTYTLSSTPPNGVNAVTTTNSVKPFLGVTVTEQVRTYLLSLLPGVGPSITVTGHCDCGIASTPSPEQSITGWCPFNEFAYDTSAWDSASSGQIRTTGSNFGEGDSANYVFFNCDDTWYDQNGNSHAWNYLSTLSGVSVDDVAMREYAGNQESGPGHAVVTSVALVSSATPFTPEPCSGGSGQPSIPGVNVIDWGATDYLIESINETAALLYEEDTNPAYSPWATQPPTWNESLPPSGESYSWLANPDTGSQPYMPSLWLNGDGAGSINWWTKGSDSSAIVNALSTNRYFGFGWCFQGNDNRIFIGNTSTYPSVGSMTIYFHQGGSSVGTFATY